MIVVVHGMGLSNLKVCPMDVKEYGTVVAPLNSLRLICADSTVICAATNLEHGRVWLGPEGGRVPSAGARETWSSLPPEVGENPGVCNAGTTIAASSIARLALLLLLACSGASLPLADVENLSELKGGFTQFCSEIKLPQPACERWDLATVGYVLFIVPTPRFFPSPLVKDNSPSDEVC